MDVFIGMLKWGLDDFLVCLSPNTFFLSFLRNKNQDSMQNQEGWMAD